MGPKIIQMTKGICRRRGRMIHAPNTFFTMCFSDSYQDPLVSLSVISSQGILLLSRCNSYNYILQLHIVILTSIQLIKDRFQTNTCNYRFLHFIFKRKLHSTLWALRDFVDPGKCHGVCLQLVNMGFLQFLCYEMMVLLDSGVDPELIQVSR